jgi:hypothetical protein
MKLVTLMLAGVMRWNVRPNDPAEVTLASLGGCRLVNPLIFAPEGDILPIAADCCHLLTQNLTFVLSEVADAQEIVNEKHPEFLRTLRIVAKQAAMPTEALGFQSSERDQLPSFKYPKTLNMKGTLFGKYRVDTAATMEHVSKTDQLGLKPNIPVCHEILLDALQACEQRDEREAILYAAIAVEALARTALEIEYQKVVAAAQPPAHTNVMEFPQAGGVTVRKDPVYALLAEGDHFARLLHEVPAYLLRRSLLRDDPALYRRAVNLYRTRNRLSHGQVIEPGDADLLVIDSEGAFEGLETAIAVFRWFGSDGYMLPRMVQVPLWQPPAPAGVA